MTCGNSRQHATIAMTPTFARALIGLVSLTVSVNLAAQDAPRVAVTSGMLLGALNVATGVRAYKGIPFAAPPTGALRWQPPTPAPKWTGTRPATAFGPRCMQLPVYLDMVFRSNGMSEDCLYLNVWAPQTSGAERLPVLVYFYGGGFLAGDGSEPRYDGEAMARKGIVALTVNYRLNVFGFFAHPELTRESPHHASGNYGLLDQAAALRWVRRNIAAFGGDPARVTIAGESAGSISVSAQMASPLSKGLIAGAIGESGAMIAPTLPAVPLAEGEQHGAAFASAVGASTLDALRALPADRLLKGTAAPGIAPFYSATIDGYFLPSPPVDIFAGGAQAHVPLLAGWNSAESDASGILGKDPPTPGNYARNIQRLYGDRAQEILKLYPGATADDVRRSATDLASDRFISYSTWKWLDVHGRTGGRPVFRYFYQRPRPPAPGQRGGASAGAEHSAEIEYAMGNLATNKAFAWTADDRKVSAILQGYFSNFVTRGDPNGPGLPAWTAANHGVPQVMHIDVQTRLEAEAHAARYALLDSLYRPAK
jgi:para-nitrobenzyl esterase